LSALCSSSLRDRFWNRLAESRRIPGPERLRKTAFWRIS